MMTSNLGAQVEEFRRACLALSGAGQRGSMAGKRLGMVWKLTAIKNNLSDELHYRLLPVRLTEHLKDCFGFAVTL